MKIIFCVLNSAVALNFLMISSMELRDSTGTLVPASHAQFFSDLLDVPYTNLPQFAPCQIPQTEEQFKKNVLKELANLETITRNTEIGLDKLNKELTEVRAIIVSLKQSNPLIDSNAPNPKKRKTSEIPIEQPAPRTSNRKLAMLCNAIKSGKTDEVETLLKDAHLNINEQSELELTGLVREIGKAGQTRTRVVTPLHLAVFLEHQDIVALLLAKRANPDTSSDQGYTPLMTATASLNTQIIKLLLRAKANKNATDCTGRTAFDIARMKNHPKIVQLLQASQPR